ncbi:nucleotide sugar dehydrogenase [Nocardioides sp.]|uniref:nucleotide sugar dehydrogenase n=1 Tax=Nocardioides sp. TaxID=35761 RepID=UPI0039E4A56C
MTQTTAPAGSETLDLVVVGGGGHVGLPLAIGFASRGLKAGVYDINQAAIDLINAGDLPFQEDGAKPVLEDVLAKGLLSATTDPAVVAKADTVIVVIGTPVDEHLNPDPRAVTRALADLEPHLRDGQLLVLRSTVYPGVTEAVERQLTRQGRVIDIAFCPERIAEGKAMEELFSLPQIVSGRSQEVRDRAAKLFGNLTDSIVELEPEEAELAKLFTNTWRYIKFAAANQFYMMANDAGLSYDKIRRALAQDYPRARDIPGAGFAAGPCLFKDTMQLAAFTDNSFALGHSAMLVNEGLPLYLVTRLEKKHDLSELTVGILGMAFKAESDDIRSSLSYKLKRILEFRAKRVLTTDPYVTVDDDLLPLKQVVAESDLLILAAPHAAYAELDPSLPIVDLWNFLGAGGVV